MVLSRISTLSLQTQEAWTRSAVVRSPIPFLLPFFFGEPAEEASLQLATGPAAVGEERRRCPGDVSLQQVVRKTQPRTQGRCGSSCAPLPNAWRPGSLVGRHRRQSGPPGAPPGETLPPCSPKTDQRSLSDSFGEKRLQLEGCS